MIGSTLGHYEIVERIGRGGMGEVYRARDTKLDRDVAVKILPADRADDLEGIQRFEREAKAVAALNHPNIVTIYSVEHVGEHRFLTMELVSGKTLAELIPEGGFALERFFEISIPLADALSAAHNSGVAHRDLKPSNVMIDDSGRLKVLDFGLAKLLAAPDESNDDTVVAAQAVTAEGKIVGTVAYMSPEQAESKALDHRSDIFSLGVVLYEMATGDRPFQGDTPLSTMSAILKDEPTPVTERKLALPRHLGRVIGRCLEKKPERRFQTARDVCNELEGLREEVESGEIEQLVSATLSRDDLMAEQLKAGRRNPMGWVVAAVLLAAIGAYFVFGRGGDGGGTAGELQVTPMTSLVGVEDPGSWSPDGSFFAYAHCADGPMDIFIASSVGGDPMPLVVSPSDDVAARWSPDNRWIAFVSNRGQSPGVYLVPPLGGQPQFLVSLQLPRLSGLAQAGLGTTPWSADAKRLLFARRDDDGRVRIWEMDLDTRQERRVSEPGAGESDGLASFSHSGDWILFLRSGADRKVHLMLVPASGGQARELYAEETRYLIASWSPDDETILYSLADGGLRRLDVDSGAVERVTTGDQENSPVVANDGRVLYATSSHQTDLYLQDLATGESKRLTRHTKDNFSAQLSPDGNFVAYASSRTGDWEIWLLDLSTGNERMLTQREGGSSSPCWTPDGKEILFASRHGGSFGIWSVASSGGAPRLLGNYPEASSGPQISPDGELIGFRVARDSGRDLHVISRDGGDSRLLFEGVAHFCWYLDSKRILYEPSDPERRNELRARNLETGEDLLLTTTEFAEMEVARDGSILSFVSSLSHFNMNLHVLRLDVPADPSALPTAMGEVEKVTHGDGEWHVHNGSIDSDGSRVVYTRDTDAGDIYLLTGVF